MLTSQSWAPNIKTALLSFLAVRTLSAIYNYNFISDCDEVMNYWEPTHYLMYGNGFQTWEYSPVYGIRSYGYIALHAAIGFLISLFTSNKITIFFGIRLALGALSALCETYFYNGVSKRFGSHVGLFTFLFLLGSPGMFIASTAFLPSSFSMYCLTFAFGAWFNQRYTLAVTAVAAATILGWPFCVVLTAPLAIDILIRSGFVNILGWGLLSLLYFLVPSVIVDYFYYHKWVVCVWNIIMYNVFTSHGANIYGVEPWTYYIANLFLNFNVALFLALATYPLLAIFKFFNRSLPGMHFAYILPFYIWFGIMIKMQHKEERFLFVIYPLIALGAAVSLVILMEFGKRIIAGILGNRVKFISVQRFVNYCVWVLFLGFLLLSISRVVSLCVNYNAPLHVYTHLSEVEFKKPLPIEGKVHVCVGKEWYRFASNFFLPSEKYELSFVKSGFGGQLPKLYSPGNGTWIIPENFNDQNLEEPSRYIDMSQCHYFIDLEVPNQTEPYYSKDSHWEVIQQYPFLDSANSHPIFRAFFVPIISKERNSFANYYILKRKL